MNERPKVRVADEPSANIGGFGVYYFRGALGEPDALVVARTQNGEHYLGGGLLGGQWVGRIHTEGVGRG